MNILEARRMMLGAGVYKKTATGNPVSVRSLARMRPGLSLYGKSNQNTVAGNQLIPMTVGEEIVSENGFVSATRTEDGVNIEAIVGASVQAHSDIYFIGTGSTVDDYEAYPDFEAGKTYIVRCDSLNYSLYVSVLRDGGMVTLCHSDDTVGNGTFTPEEGDTFRVFLRPRKIYTEPENEVVHVMISSNMDAPIWEPYTGGQPSPSTDYPQEIVSAGDDGSIQVDVGGANLFDAKTSLKTKIESGIVSVNDDGSIMLNGTFNNSNRQFFITLQPGTYYLSCDYGNVFHILAPTDSLWNRSISVDAEQEFFCYISSGVYNNKVIRAMINKGSTALPWEPYKQPQTLTVQTPNGLPGLPVTSGGNYVDENGQQWICDEVDFRRGKYVQKIILIPLTGSNLQAAFPSEQYGTYVNTNRGNLLRYPSQKLVMSDQYIGVAFDDRTTLVDGFRTYIDNTGRLVIRLPVGDNRSLEEIKVAVDEQKPHFLCALAAPIETDLTPEQMQAYESLHTNRPTTVVSATDGAGLELTYKTKKSLEVTA